MMTKTNDEILEELYSQMRESSIDISPTKLSEYSHELSDLYLDNFDSYLENATKLKKSHPYEIVYLTSELVKSDFALKVMGDFNDIFKKDKGKWSLEEKVRLIRDTYESIYQHFILATVCMMYSEQFMEELRSDWYKPFKSKDRILKGDDNWYFEGQKCVGKYFVLMRSPIFKYLSKSDKELLKNIRNNDSHYKTVILNENVLLLDEDNSSNVTEEINSLFARLLDCYRAAYNIYVNIFSFQRFWIAPVVGLTFNSQLEIKDRTVLFSLLNGLVENKKEKPSKLKDDKHLMRVASLFFVIIYFLNIKIWRILTEEQKFIESVATKFDKKFSTANLELTRKQSIIEVINFLKLSIAKADQFAAGGDKPIITNLTVDDYSEEKIIEEYAIFSERILEILQSDRRDDGIVFGLLSFGMALLTPIRNIKERFESLFTDK